MTKAEIIELLSEKHKIAKAKAEIVVNTIFDSIVSSLVNDGRTEIRGFGTFVNRDYDARKGRNPKTGAVINVAAKKLPFFKAGKELKTDLNSQKES